MEIVLSQSTCGLLHCDINDDGAINADDDTARYDGDPEYLRTEDAQDNGGGTVTHRAENAPLDLGVVTIRDFEKIEVSDDVQTILLGTRSDTGTILPLGPGTLEYTLEPSDGLTLLKSRTPNQKQELQDRVETPFTLESGTFPTELYLHADNTIKTERTGILTVTYTPANGGDPITDTLTLCIVPGVGSPHYFDACRDYMAENATKFFTAHPEVRDSSEWERYRFVCLPHEKTTMNVAQYAYPTYRPATVETVAQDYPGYTVYINGVYFAAPEIFRLQICVFLLSLGRFSLLRLDSCKVGQSPGIKDLQSPFPFSNCTRNGGSTFVWRPIQKLGLTEQRPIDLWRRPSYTYTSTGCVDPHTKRGRRQPNGLLF